jgi:hypothetical protein
LHACPGGSRQVREVLRPPVVPRDSAPAGIRCHRGQGMN